MKVILEWYTSGGPFIGAIVIAALAGIALAVERATYLTRRSRVHARQFMEQVLLFAREGKLEEALALCAEHQAALPDVGLVMLRTGGTDARALRDVADAARATIKPLLLRRIAWVGALAAITGLLGLCGAAAEIGRIMTAGAASPDATRAAVLQAARTVGAGAFAATVLVLAHAWIAQLARTLLGDLDEFAQRLLNAMAKRPDVRLGDRA